MPRASDLKRGMRSKKTMDVDIFCLSANQVKSAIQIFADCGIPSLTFSLARHGISICELDSAGATVVSCFFDKNSFLVYNGVAEDILFTVDTLAIAACLKTSTSSCCLRLSFEGSDDAGSAEAEIIPKRLILTRTVDSVAPPTSMSSEMDDYDDPLGATANDSGSLSFRYEVPILECAPSQVKIDSTILESSYNWLSIVIRHSTLSQIVKEFSRMAKKMIRISSYYRASDKKHGILFSSKIDGSASSSDSDSNKNNNKGSKEEIEVVLLDEEFVQDPQGHHHHNQVGGGGGSCCADLELSGLKSSQQIAMSAAPHQDVISGVYSVKKLHNQQKSQLAKQVRLSLLPPRCDPGDNNDAADDEIKTAAVLIIRQESSMGVVNIISPSVD